MPGRSLTAPDLVGAGASIAVAQGAGLVGLPFNARLRRDYPKLVKPAGAPPPAVFGPVWIVLYTLVGVAGWLVARSPATSERDRALVLHATHLGLNAAWTPLFATGHRRAALVDIVALWATVAVAIRAFWKVSIVAAALLVPYLAWSSFALYLNLGIVRRNPAGGPDRQRS